eukprot:4445476-Pyramimonas_sp.AAC.1
MGPELREPIGQGSGALRRRRELLPPEAHRPGPRADRDVPFQARAAPLLVLAVLTSLIPHIPLAP